MKRKVVDRRFWKRVLVNFSLLFSSICLVIILAELGLYIQGRYRPWVRTYVGDYKSEGQGDSFITDEKIGWRMRPSTTYFETNVEGQDIAYQSDAQGFRTYADRVIQDQPAIRIGVVGDSFMWGLHVPYSETCAHLLESAIQDCVVHNFAMPGFGVDQIWQSLHYWGLPLKPDLIIVGLYIHDFDRSFNAYSNSKPVRKKPVYKSVDDRLVPLYTTKLWTKLWRFAVHPYKSKS